ncbi:heterodisulfide reductase-related iron-sulfur binding cluster [Corynebacterium atrinae]|uniref:heterodisulfide reductase-related iron-sulfur binding cluster n=1 Tax=Corynebacterium atrinae TaxID=1336740 RepID=UPI0025B30398|nr:heterodisulfide reductase-related iron-sulfur binding cluster [Corynebacterium atrinae]
MSIATTVLGIIGIGLAVPAFLYFLTAAFRMLRYVRQGQPLPEGTRTSEPARRLAQVIIEVFGHTHFKGRPLVNIAHWLVMVGFLVGILVWFEAFIQTFNPAGGWPFLSEWPAYHFIEEVLAVGTVVGIVALIIIRIRQGTTSRASRFYESNAVAARAIETIVFAEGLGMLLVKASKLATYGGGSPWADFLSIHLATLLPASPTLVSVMALVKLLAGMVFLILMGYHLSWGVGWHRFLAFFNIFFQRNPDGHKALGALKPMTSGTKVLTLDNVDEVDTLGVGTAADASWKMLLDAATCTDCGRCQDLCPAWNTGKPLNPKLLMTGLRDATVDKHANLDVLSMTSIVPDDVLWSCTNCGACVDQCPVDIEHLDHVADLRRFRVLAESDFPSELTGLFKNLETKGNPWGRNSSERASWVDAARRDGLTVPVIGEDLDDFSDTEYLFWVGCAGAFDDAGQRTTRAVIELLQTAGVKYAVLSTGETCTGDPARRAGNEFLFQMLATENIATLNDTFEGVPAGQRKIITTCPHCFNTIRNEYPDFGGHFDVFHHTQLLNRLVRDGLLTPVPRTPENRQPITYHDPCFLGRHNQIYDPPRELLAGTGVELREMDNNRAEAFCCGAGGSRMFMEETIGQRVNEFRTEQALATGATEIATGCPFCNTMFTGGLKALSPEDPGSTQVRDVAVMLRDSVLIDGALPPAREPAFLEAPRRQSLPIKPAQPVDSSEKAPSAPERKDAEPQQASVPPAQPSAVPAPGALAPHAPPAPGTAMPSAPGTSVPTSPESSGDPSSRAVVPPAPGSAVPPIAGSAVPPPPGTSVPPAPGGAVPQAPGTAVPPAPGTAVPPAPNDD